MKKTWMAMCAVALVAATGGIVAGRALAEDPPADPAMEVEKPIDGLGLVKTLTANKWTTKATGMLNSTGTASFRLAAGKTALIEDYDSTGDIGPYNAIGVFKFSADGKTATMWWLSNHDKKPEEFTGSVTDTGYELTGPSPHDPNGKVILKLTKKGDTLEFTYASGGEVNFTDVWTKAK